MKIVICDKCDKKYIEEESSDCPYCKIKSLIEDAENLKYENALNDCW